MPGSEEGSFSSDVGLLDLLEERLFPLPWRNFSFCSSKSFSTFVEGVGGPVDLHVAGVVPSNASHSDVKKCSVIEQAC